MNICIHTHQTCLHICKLVRCSSIWRIEQKTEGEETRDRTWMINDYIHMYSILPASASLPLLSSEPKPRLPKWGTPKIPPTAYCCHPSPLKGPAHTQLSFRQLLPSSPSEEERGLREGGCRATRTIEEYVHLYSHTTSIYPTPPTHPPPPHLHPLFFIYVSGLVFFSASYLSEGRYNPSFETYS